MEIGMSWETLVDRTVPLCAVNHVPGGSADVGRRSYRWYVGNSCQPSDKVEYCAPHPGKGSVVC